MLLTQCLLFGLIVELCEPDAVFLLPHQSMTQEIMNIFITNNCPAETIRARHFEKKVS